jgi:hypothetical protein
VRQVRKATVRNILWVALIAALALGAVLTASAAEEKTKAAAREESIRQNLPLFSIGFHYYGPAEEGRNSLGMIVTKAGGDRGPPDIVIDLPREQAALILEYLIREGYIGRALDRYGAVKFPEPKGPAYVVEVGDGYVHLAEDYGWGDRTVAMFEGVLGVLPKGNPRNQVQKILDVVKPAVAKEKAAAAAKK